MAVELVATGADSLPAGGGGNFAEGWVGFTGAAAAGVEVEVEVRAGGVAGSPGSGAGVAEPGSGAGVAELGAGAGGGELGAAAGGGAARSAVVAVTAAGWMGTGLGGGGGPSISRVKARVAVLIP